MGTKLIDTVLTVCLLVIVVQFAFSICNPCMNNTTALQQSLGLLGRAGLRALCDCAVLINTLGTKAQLPLRWEDEVVFATKVKISCI